MPSLIHRQKWACQKRSHKIGDLVLVVDQNLPRGLWCLGRIIELKYGANNFIRSATVRVSKCKDKLNLKFETTTLERPINKLVLITPAENL